MPVPATPDASGRGDRVAKMLLGPLLVVFVVVIDVIDNRLIGALHVRALDRTGLTHDGATEHVV